MQNLNRLSLHCLFIFILGCNNSTPTGVEKSSDRIVAGVNFTQLFAPPTADEISAIKDEWASRGISAENYQLVDSSQVLLGSAQATLRIVSHTVDGFRHYGAILTPNNAAAGSLPVMVYTHGGDGGLSVTEFQFIASFNDNNADKYVYVAPSFRSEPLRTESKFYRSEGDPSPWDRDVDDALALLNVALQNTPEANPDHIGIIGFSRGAAVAMLMAIRDPRIELVVEFFGPTDFYGEFVQTVTEETLLGQPRDLPGLDFLNETLIQPLQKGQLSIEEVRVEILRRSPVYFAEALPQLQVHHGTADPIVPVGEAERLIAVMQDLGRTAPDFESYLYPNGTHNPFTLPGSISRSANFLSRMLRSQVSVFSIRYSVFSNQSKY
ncbi:MAG: alpha/beta hydrolase family protein [bacterium]